MQFTEVTFDDAVPIDGYGPGFFRIGGQVYNGALVVEAAGVRPWGGLNDAQTLTALAGKLDVLFIGMGDTLAHPPKALREAVEEAGLGLEPMSSPSACRTFNVLLSEGRRVGAALLPVGPGE
ncbi:Mth938-like domain-containing protein [Aliiroseovarius sp. PTFE2010]|uniref:Mth938-like domain-containing protein n=1 Tax=Aliiroseovarius sp. PTFE2010 TaxID=3417190 RepID=UPI003CEE5F0D